MIGAVMRLSDSMKATKVSKVDVSIFRRCVLSVVFYSRDEGRFWKSCSLTKYTCFLRFFFVPLYLGVLNRSELRRAIEDITRDEIDLDLMELIFSEFDKDGNGVFDDCEFRGMMKYITGATATQSRRKSVSTSRA